MLQPQLRRIRASAGSGKTYELTSRFVSLLATAKDREGEKQACALPRLPRDGYAWQEIMAVTFTNRAAEEMRSRIISRLKSIALGLRADKVKEDAPLTPALAAYWIDVLLRRFNALQVRTIDSLLHQIVRMSALELDLPPDFIPSFNTYEALAPLMDTLMESARSTPEIHQLVDDACRDLLFHSQKINGFTVGDNLRNATTALAMRLQDSTLPRLANSAELMDRLTTLRNAACAHAIHLAELIDRQNLKANANLIKVLSKFKQLTPEDDIPDSAMLRKSCLDECLNKISKGQASSEAESTYAALSDALAQLRQEGPILRSGLKLAPFLGLAELITKALPEFFRLEGRIPAVLMPQLAEQALKGPDGVSMAFCRMGTTLTHILIDEFQDTSREQWSILHPLALEAVARGGSLTWVGDVKQAIYGWRGGDALLFDEIGEDHELRAIVPYPHTDTLLTNHRSCSAIVRSNNAIFSRLADPQTAKSVLRSLLGEVSASQLDEDSQLLVRAFTGAAQLECGKTGGYVRMTRISGEYASELDDKICSQLISLLQELSTRRSYGEIAVLTRSNIQAEKTAQWLLAANIPVVTENSFMLASHPLIKELIALLEFINVPEDDAAFWGVLSGKILAGSTIALSSTDLNDWLCQQAHRTTPLWHCFKRDFPDAWQKFFAPFHNESGLIGAYDAVSEALERYDILHRFSHDAPFARRFMEVLYLAEEEGRGNISAFLEYWGDHGREEKAPMPDALDAVRVMTVHKAKGLQFPIVIVPWSNLTPRVASTPVLTETSDGQPMLAAPVPEMTDVYPAMLGKSAREELHLLYVAWSRPEEELYVFLNYTPRTASSSQALDILLRNIPEEQGTPAAGHAPAPHTHTEKKESLPPYPPVLHDARNEVYSADPTHQPLSADAGARRKSTIHTHSPSEFSDKDVHAPWRPMDWLPELKIFRNPLGEIREAAAARGTLAHLCLEQLRLTGNTSADIRRAVERGMSATSIPEEQHAVLEKQMCDMLTWYASLPEASDWLKHGSAEHTIADDDGNLYRADILVDNGLMLTVIDYKTGGKSVSHVRQISRYMDIVARSQELPVRGVLVYLDLHECVEI